MLMSATTLIGQRADLWATWAACIGENRLAAALAGLHFFSSCCMQVKVNVDHCKRVAQQQRKCYTCNRGLNATELQEFIKHQVCAQGPCRALSSSEPLNTHLAFSALHVLREPMHA